MWLSRRCGRRGCPCLAVRLLVGLARADYAWLGRRGPAVRGRGGKGQGISEVFGFDPFVSIQAQPIVIFTHTQCTCSTYLFFPLKQYICVERRHPVLHLGCQSRRSLVPLGLPGQLVSGHIAQQAQALEGPLGGAADGEGSVVIRQLSDRQALEMLECSMPLLLLSSAHYQGRGTRRCCAGCCGDMRGRRRGRRRRATSISSSL